MDTITDIAKTSLAEVLSALAQAKMKVGSIADADGTYSVTYEPSPSSSDGASLSSTLPTAPPVANMDSPSPPVAGAPGAFVHARAIAPKTILYTDAEGRDEIREGGSRSWRNCNAGNIRKGDFSINCGAIGDDGSFAIFPDEETGKAAIIALLRTATYIKLTLKEAIFRYAPPSENNSEAYAQFIHSKTGIALNAVLSSLKMDDFRKIARFIQIVEGWKPGIIRSNAPPAPLMSTAIGVASSAASATQDWMMIARREAALPVRERSQWPDPGENPRILNYFRVSAPWFEVAGGDEVDWCAAFVNYCLVSSGHMGTDHPGARSFFWNKKKQFLVLKEPKPGAIAVRRYAPFSDPDWATGNGHVGFVVSWTSTTVTLLGGNQSNTVCEKTFPRLEKNGNTKESEFVRFLMPVIV
ncbi:conjugal transfer protein [Rhizobium sp. Root708]|uniref:TIGR02594 family protein n=1 Tax=Rhizobium sp. Root708 TaxID=1736592 RepID=UPI0006FFB119|nr:TIGR02594 family protein [Rhizobium sp. Root708]KRB60288.1 conjugal transfer protein [Rhizobium sp. Root708]